MDNTELKRQMGDAFDAAVVKVKASKGKKVVVLDNMKITSMITQA